LTQSKQPTFYKHLELSFEIFADIGHSKF